MAESVHSATDTLDLDSSLGKDNYSNPIQTLELSIFCRDLITPHSTNVSAVIAIYTQEPDTSQFKEYDRTEPVKIHDMLEFTKKIHLEYFFEESADNLKFVMYHVEKDSKNNLQQKIFGETMATIGDIIMSRSKPCNLKLKNQSENKGEICIRAEVPDNSRDVIAMSWKGRKTNRGQMLFQGKLLKLKISKINEDRSFTLCFKSRQRRNHWNNIAVSVQALCNADEERTIKFEVFEAEKDGRDGAFVGDFDTYLKRLSGGPGRENTYECKKRIQNGNEIKWETTANFSLTDFMIRRQPTFLDYIQNGMEVSFVVGIDFTASNGECTDPNSLHYLHPDHPNEYELAIRGAGYVLQQYDTDRRFPSFGFGARVPPNGRISHKFPINFSQDPNCNGVDEILNAYRKCVQRVELDRPTNLAPIIRHVTDLAKQVQEASNYYVLLIVTNGVFTDRDATIAAIVEAARTPMSIVIVGVGNGNFAEMVELDGDDERLNFRGERAERDIVQFVPLTDYLTEDRSRMAKRGRYTKEILEEIPDQIVKYMMQRQLSPGMGTRPHQ